MQIELERLERLEMLGTLECLFNAATPVRRPPTCYILSTTDKVIQAIIPTASRRAIAELI
jgi:hypothetical protein